MQFEFDPAKNVSNFARHGVALSFAEDLSWDEALVWIDDRYEYSEERMIGLLPEGETLYYVVFVDREETRRIISLRKAERSEVKHYVENYC
jgi:uncharacterized protein